jgi:3-oxoacyl-[acyl-carrier protein] reductase
MHKLIDKAFSLDGRVAVVTGAASGIGREIARLFALAGATPVLCDVQADGLAESAELIAQDDGQSVTAHFDVTNRAAIEATADRAAAINGCVDIWVNAAGIIANRPIIDAVDEEVERVIAVNLKGVYWGCAAAGRVMRQAGAGSIINLSSSGADSVNAGLSLYSMTKAAVNMVTRTAAVEYGPFGVRVNAIAPGWVETPMGAHRFRDASGEIDSRLREEGLRLRAAASPLGMTGVPLDIAFAALYLAADASRFMTGQIVRPNGGVAMP